MTPSSTPLKAEVVRLLREAAGDDGFREIRAEFLGGTPGVFAAMRRAVDADDAPTLKRLAHSLRGSSGSLGAEDLSAACRALEDRLAAGASARGERTRVDALAADFDGVRRALEAL